MITCRGRKRKRKRNRLQDKQKDENIISLVFLDLICVRVIDTKKICIIQIEGERR
jgi:hypothetical protein